MSEIRVDTISEKTSANGVAIDSVTLKDGGATLTDNITFSASGKGVHLGVTSATASNLLDDYEEGTWTPVISADAVAGAYGSQLGDYVKIGRQVTILFTINISTIGSFAGAQTKVTGLPFASGDLNRHSFGTLFIDGAASEVQAAGDLATRVTSNSSQILFQGNSGNTDGDNNINANKFDTGTFIHGSVTYFTD
mgnify:CR=1 FL=1